MSVNVKAIIREGVNAYHAGNREEAKTLLLKAIEMDENNEDAWMWLSGVVDTIEDQQICLENVLTINPANEKARQGLTILQQKAASAPDPFAGMPINPASPSVPAVEEDDPFANVSFTADPTPPPVASAPAYADDDEDEDELPDEMHWSSIPATETSSASRVGPVAEPSPAEYDDWVSNLNLGKSSENPFGDIDEEDFPAADPAYIAEESIFGFDEDDPITDTYEEPAFAASTYDDEDEEDGPFDFSNDAEAFFKDPEPAIAPSRPTEEARYSPEDTSRSLLLADDEDDYDDEDDERFNLNDYADEFDLDAVKPSDYFSMIPKEIQATRLPGTHEKHPALVMLSLGVLFLLNLAAVGYLVFSLTNPA